MQRQYIQIDEISLNDLNNYPIWEYLSEDDPNAKDECTIKGHKSNPEKIDSMIIVRAKFKLYDGTEFEGYVRPEDGLSNAQPVIVINDRYIYFWNGIREKTREQKQEDYRILEKTAEEVFPVKWNAVIKTGMVDSGTISGFGNLDAKNDYADIYSK